MKRRAMNWTLAVLTVLFVTPLAARAATTSIFSTNVCTTGSLILCNDFEVTYDDGAGQYHLIVTNNAAGSTVPDPGFITGVGIFDLSGSNTYGLQFVEGMPSGWTDAIAANSSVCNDLGSGGYPHQDLVVAYCYNGSTTVQTVDITFTSSAASSTLATAFTDGSLIVAGDHTQGLGTCSAKFYSDGTAITSDGTSLDNCYATVPEPATFLLLGTGLLGLAGVQWRRRRLHDEEA